MSKRDLILDKYNISKYAYRELCYFCLQYKDKKEKLKALYGVQGGMGNGMPRANNISNPTEKQAILAVSLSKDLEMIEQAAIETDSSIYQNLIDNVCYRLPYEKIEVPAGREYFYLKRRIFFYLLATKKGII